MQEREAREARRWKSKCGKPGLDPSLPPASRAGQTKASSSPGSIGPLHSQGHQTRGSRGLIPALAGHGTLFGIRENPFPTCSLSTSPAPGQRATGQTGGRGPFSAGGPHPPTPKESALGLGPAKAWGIHMVPGEPPYQFQGPVGGSSWGAVSAGEVRAMSLLWSVRVGAQKAGQGRYGCCQSECRCGASCGPG